MPILSKTENEKKLYKVFRVIFKTKNPKIVLPPSSDKKLPGSEPDYKLAGKKRVIFG